METFRAVITYVLDYGADPESYPECTTTDERRAVLVEAIKKSLDYYTKAIVPSISVYTLNEKGGQDDKSKG